MCTITISRQLGSLGLDVAALVAEGLAYRLVRRQVINQAALRAGAPEAALAAIDELGLFKMSPSPQESQAYHAAVQQVMVELAKEGKVVIVGRAGQVILRDHPDVLHVRIIAPMALRVERVASRHGISSEAASAQIQASDRYRRNYLRRFYHVQLDDPELYDLTINTEHLTVSVAAEIVIAAARLYPSGAHSVSPEQHDPGINDPR